MSKPKTASLAAMFASKGDAKPADATKPVEAPAAVQMPSQATPVSEQVKPVEAAPVVQSTNLPLATKSLTVKVDVATYGKLKAHGGALGGKTNQDIFIEALGLYFSKHGIK